MSKSTYEGSTALKMLGLWAPSGTADLDFYAMRNFFVRTVLFTAATTQVLFDVIDETTGLMHGWAVVNKNIPIMVLVFYLLIVESTELMMRVFMDASVIRWSSTWWSTWFRFLGAAHLAVGQILTITINQTTPSGDNNAEFTSGQWIFGAGVVVYALGVMLSTRWNGGISPSIKCCDPQKGGAYTPHQDQPVNSLLCLRAGSDPRAAWVDLWEYRNLPTMLLIVSLLAADQVVNYVNLTTNQLTTWNTAQIRGFQYAAIGYMLTCKFFEAWGLSHHGFQFKNMMATFFTGLGLAAFVGWEFCWGLVATHNTATNESDTAKAGRWLRFAGVALYLFGVNISWRARGRNDALDGSAKETQALSAPRPFGP